MCDRFPPPSAPNASACQNGHTTTLGRRFFLWQLLSLIGFWTLWPMRSAQAKRYGIRRGSVKVLESVGGSAQVKLKGQDVLLIRDSPTSVRALNPMCTHKKCLVRYHNASGDIQCKCHKSKFTLDGQVVSGPAPRALTTYPASITSEQIIVELPET